MAKPGRGASKRREPSLKSGAATLDVRLSPEDRSAAPASEAARTHRSARMHSAKPNVGKARVEPKLDVPVAPRPAVPPKKTRTAGARSGRRGRSGLFRLVYWGAVLAIWAVLAAAGVFAWVGMHLPPIQSLEIPKRPPSIQINSLDARIFATRGEMGGAALPLRDMPAHLPNGTILAGVAPSPAATPASAPPMPPAAVPGRGREPIRPAEGTIDGWLINRLFPGR